MFAPSRRNARLVLTVAALAALELIFGISAADADHAIVRADFGVTGAVLIVTAALNFLSGLFRGRIDPNVRRSLDGMRSTIRDIGSAIVQGLAWFGGKMMSVLAAVKRFIQRTFGPLFDMLKKLVQRIGRILDKIFGPIIEFLEDVKKHVWKFYNDFVKPVLDIIEFIRLPLRILSAFGVEWAKRLDATLANLEDWITEQFTFVMGKLNQAINFLNMVVDVNGLLKRFTLMNSLLRDIHIQSAMWWRWRMKDESPAERARRNRRLGERTIEDVPRDTELAIVTGDGPYGPIVREMSIQWRMYIERATG